MMKVDDLLFHHKRNRKLQETKTGTKRKTQQGHSIPRNYEILGAIIYPYSHAWYYLGFFLQTLTPKIENS
jgi:hypothetical protein